MLKTERLEKIEDFVNQNKYVTITELTKKFGVSKATVRRDLLELEEEKKIVLARGGVMSKQKGTTFEPPYAEKQRINNAEKQRIAKAACALVEQGDMIMLDSGTTIFELTEFMFDVKGVSIATSDLMVAMGLTKYSDINTILIGGGPVRKGYYTIIGHYAEHMLSQLHFDKAFMAVDSIDVVHGGMITNMDELTLKTRMIEASNEVIILCDHSKFESTAFVSFCSIENISKIITGRELKPEIYRKFIDAGKEVQLV